MIGWDASLQGRRIVLDLVIDGRMVTAVFDPTEAEELAERLVELVIENDLEDCIDGPEELYGFGVVDLDDLDDEEEDAA